MYIFIWTRLKILHNYQIANFIGKMMMSQWNWGVPRIFGGTHNYVPYVSICAIVKTCDMVMMLL